MMIRPPLLDRARRTFVPSARRRSSSTRSISPSTETADRLPSGPAGASRRRRTSASTCRTDRPRRSMRAITSACRNGSSPRSALIDRRGLSVRQVEALVRRLREAPAGPDGSRSAVSVDGEMERVEEDLRRALGTKVRLARSSKGGRIIIEWYGEDELGRLYERLTGGNS